MVEEEKGGRQVSETIPADKKPLRYIFASLSVSVQLTHLCTCVCVCVVGRPSQGSAFYEV